MSFLFGSPSTQTSSSDSTSIYGNNSYNTLNSTLSPLLSNGGAGSDMMASILGLNGTAAAAPAAQTWNTGYNPVAYGGTAPGMGINHTVAQNPQIGLSGDAYSNAPLSAPTGVLTAPNAAGSTSSGWQGIVGTDGPDVTGKGTPVVSPTSTPSAVSTVLGTQNPSPAQPVATPTSTGAPQPTNPAYYPNGSTTPVYPTTPATTDPLIASSIGGTYPAGSVSTLPNDYGVQPNLAGTGLTGTGNPATNGTTAPGGALNPTTALLGGPTPTTPTTQPAASAQDALNNFANSAGMQFAMQQGTNAVDQGMAGKGMALSGDTLKSLSQYGQGLGQTYLNQYMQNLNSLMGNAGEAGRDLAIGGTYGGSTSVGSGSGTGAKPGLLGDVGSGLGSAISAVAAL